MIVTNKLGLPAPLYSLVKNDDYSRGEADISITGLLKPPRMVALEEAHKNEIVEDASDRIWSLYGKLVHKLLETAEGVGVAEQRLFMRVEGWTVSGQTDLLRLAPGKGFGTILEDWKFVTAWKAKSGTPKEYIEQLNGYAALLRENGYQDIASARVVALLRDWSKLEAKRDREYPQRQVAYLPVPLWPHTRAMAFLRERVMLHQAARRSLPACTPEERWSKPTTWAVKKAGRKSALRVLGSREAAEAWVVAAGLATGLEAPQSGSPPAVVLKKDISIENRPGEETRCLHYCSAAPFCDFARGLAPAKEAA